MSPEEIEALFTRSGGGYTFARWGRAIAPVVFGVDGATLAVVRGACEAVVSLAGHEMGEMDAELGSNLMFSSHAVGRKVRSPVDLGISFLRALEGTTDVFKMVSSTLSVTARCSIRN